MIMREKIIDGINSVKLYSIKQKLEKKISLK